MAIEMTTKLRALMKRMIGVGKIALLVAVCSMVTSCDDPQVYGSVGVSSYGGYGGYHGGYHGGGRRVGTSISVGGRIY
jgi:hypothetical protein